ncbi:MAG: sigma-E factor negative regulatory protein [Gammaproteobacteria bacterium]|nr:sigma-E factor negative regulatory protein [Gammaproteobacteria bacterium]
MKIDVDESLSALVDGELDAQQRKRLTDELVDNANAQRTWHNYHLVRDTLKKNLPDEIAPALFDRVSNAIAQEPHHQVVSPVITKKKSFFGFEPTYGFVAAAALIVAVVTVTQIERATISDIPTLAQSEESGVVTRPSSVVALGQIPNVTSDQLATYLANHAVRSRSYPMHDGLLPYVRSVEYRR